MPQHSEAGCHIIQDADLSTELTRQHFSSDYWLPQDATERFSEGRGDALKINLDGSEAALRQYRRGGLIRWFSKDQYIWTGLTRSRPWREFQILQHARTVDMPVPEPLAACCCRSGLSYRGSIITRFIPDTRSLSAFLRERELESELWYQLGTVIRGFHQQRLKHADLNPDNVLIDQNKRFYLIDFDRARLMKDLGDWQWRPLYRFQQSLQKRQKTMRLVYREENWMALMDGYQA